MVRGELLFIDLTEDRRLMINGLGLPAKQARRQASDFDGEGKLGAGHQTHRHAEVVGIGKAAGSGTFRESPRDSTHPHAVIQNAS